MLLCQNWHARNSIKFLDLFILILTPTSSFVYFSKRSSRTRREPEVKNSQSIYAVIFFILSLLFYSSHDAMVNSSQCINYLSFRVIDPIIKDTLRSKRIRRRKKNVSFMNFIAFNCAPVISHINLKLSALQIHPRGFQERRALTRRVHHFFTCHLISTSAPARKQDININAVYVSAIRTSHRDITELFELNHVRIPLNTPPPPPPPERKNPPVMHRLILSHRPEIEFTDSFLSPYLVDLSTCADVSQQAGRKLGNGASSRYSGQWSRRRVSPPSKRERLTAARQPGEGVVGG